MALTRNRAQTTNLDNDGPHSGPTAEMKPLNFARFAHIAAQASCLSFIIAMACLVIALVFRPLAIIGVGAFVFPVLGFLFGGIALVGATKACTEDISSALAGTAANALLAFGIWSSVLG